MALRYSTNWQDNQIESNKVLAKLRIEFQSNIEEPGYKNAIDAYNSCCEESDKIIVD